MWRHAGQSNIWLKTVLLLTVETGIIFSVVMVGLRLRFGADYGSLLIDQRGFLKIGLTTFVCQASFCLFSLYDIGRPRLRGELLTDLLMAAGSALLVLSSIFLLRPTLLLGYMHRFDGGEVGRYGNGVPLLSMTVALGLMVCWRLGIHWLMRHPRLGERVLIVGTGELAREVAAEAARRRELGYRIVGTFPGQSPDPGPGEVAGETGSLYQRVKSLGIGRVVVALEDRRGRLPIDDLLRIRLEGLAVIEEGASLYERLTGRIDLRTMRPSWIIFSDGARRGAVGEGLRRSANLLLALLGLLFTAPLMLLTAVAIRLDSPGPVFYLQERVGRHGTRFRILKFRSMRVDAEGDGRPRWASADDPRVTRVGRLLRRLRIDELPQFVNIIKGEMNFVGPRAERPYFVEQLERQIPFYAQRHLVAPGLTGWAQVCHGYGASVEEARQKLQYDLYYIKNLSLIFDLRIIVRSIRIVIFGKGR